MFESKINRGKANGYAPLDGSGKVPLSKLPPIQSTIETGSFATIGSNIFTDTQIISASGDASLTIGQLGYTSMGSFDLKATGSAVSLTSDMQSVVGVTDGIFPFGDSSIFINQINGYPYSDGPMAGIGLNKSGSVDSKLWLYDYKGKSYIPGDVTIGYTDISSTTSSGSLNIRNGNINISGSFNFLNDSGIVKVVSGSYLIENISINPSGGELSNQQGGPYCLTVLKTDLPNADTIINIGDSVVDPNNAGVGHAIVTANVITFPDNIDYWAIPIGVVDPIVFTYENNTINISGPLFKVWKFDGSGNLLTPGDINLSGSIFVSKNIDVSGSVYVSSSLVVASSVVSNGTIDALNSDLIIEGGYLILTGSVVPMSPTGSAGDKTGMVVFDDNFLYYCVNDFEAPTTGSPATFTITDGGTSHIYNLGTPGNNWNAYHMVGADPFLQTGPSQTGGGLDAPSAGWYFVDDNGIVRQLLSTPVWFSGGAPSPFPNGTGWMCVVDSYEWVYSDSNTTLTFYESIPTVTPLSSPIPPTLGGGLWKQTKLGETPNYAPFGSGSWNVQAIGEVTELDITKDIHLIDITDYPSTSNFYLPDGLYDGQVVRFALKGSGFTSPNTVYIWMNNLRTYDGSLQSNTTWSPFWDNGGDPADNPRSLATALYIDGAWNIDSDWWGM